MKMHDRRGESVLYAVLGGERKVKQGVVGSGLHQADQDLHSPSKLAEIGAGRVRTRYLVLSGSEWTHLGGA